MEAVVLVIHLIAAVSLIIVILIQPSESGGFMGSSGSMSNLMAPRRTADIMTRTTTILAGCFFATSLILAIAANHHPQAKSILDVDTGGGAKKTEATAPAPATPAAPAAVPAETPANDNAATPAEPDKKTEADKTETPAKPAIPKAPVTK